MKRCYAKRFTVSLVCLLLLVGAETTLGEPQYSSQDIHTYGTIKHADTLRVFRALTNDDLTVQQRSNASLIATCLDMYLTKDWQGKIVPLIHEINASVKVLLYRNVIVIKNTNPEWQTALNNGWLLRDVEGNYIHSTLYPTHYFVDLANQEYRDFMVTWLNNRFSLWGFDGVFADNCLKVSLSQWGSAQTPKPVNPITGKLYTDEEIRDDTISFIKYVKSRIGNKLWISNGIFQGEWFFNGYYDFVKVLTEAPLDGFMSEGLFNSGGWDMGSSQFYSEDKWKKSVDFVVWIQSNFLNQTGKLYLPNGRCLLDQIPENCTTQQMATFIFSSLLLGIEKPQNYLTLVAPLQDEIENLFRIDLGAPTGTYYLIEGSHVYARNFSKVKVLVNPTDETFTVNLNGDYETLEGQVISVVNMSPHTGLILKMIRA